jgi:hypothetical protein
MLLAMETEKPVPDDDGVVKCAPSCAALRYLEKKME